MRESSFVSDRARQTFASLARLERAYRSNPSDRGIQMNLAAVRKLALQVQDELYHSAERSKIEVCRYRIIERSDAHFSLSGVSKSLLTYQDLFSQVYDYFKSGKKERARIGVGARAESDLEFGYTYAGSLGFVLLLDGERDLISSRLDKPVEALFQVIDIRSSDDVRDIAQTMGNAVVKRVYDWSEANFEAGFAADVRWARSDGRQLGQVVERSRMEAIIGLIDAASDDDVKSLEIRGTLVGIDTVTRTFHFVVANGADYRGRLSDDFLSSDTVIIPDIYEATIEQTKQYRFATEKTETRYVLQYLRSISNETNPF